ncbi:MAG: hypothetical protein QOE02_3254, partial [Rhodospirillaceae bacterium]|nr:hypothetical protein [Rhodospirillaceae bacterium]
RLVGGAVEREVKLADLRAVCRSVAAFARRNDLEGNLAKLRDLLLAIRLAACLAASPSRAILISRSSRTFARVMSGARTDRLGRISKALSATSRRIVSERPSSASSTPISIMGPMAS